MRKINIITIATIAGCLSWLSLGIHIFCRKDAQYFSNHSSLTFIVGSNAINVSLYLSLLTSILGTYSILTNKINVQIIINILLGYTLSGFFLLLLGITAYSGGA